MCIIAVKPVGLEMFPEETIRQMFSRNRDGAGIMWQEDGKVHIKKGFMKVESFLEFVNSRNDWKDIPAVAHFRIGTAGPNDELNCHPYPVRQKNDVESECELAMVHNGILSGYNPPFGSRLNDTQVFINTVINKLPKKFLKNDAIVKLIESSIGTSKLTFLDKEGVITCIGNFIEDGGYKYSNESYKVYRPAQQKSFWEYPKRAKTAASSTLFPNYMFWNDDFFAEEPQYATFVSKKAIADVERTLESEGALISDDEYETIDGIYWLDKEHTTQGDGMLYLYPKY